MKKVAAHDHHAIVEMLKRDTPNAEMLCDLADLFKVFGDTTRMRILYALSESEMCVCAITEFLGMTQSAISHQLQVLKRYHLVRSRREGKTVLYSLSDEHVRSIIAQGYDHLTEGMPKRREGQSGE